MPTTHPDAEARRQMLERAKRSSHPRWRELRSTCLSRHPADPPFQPLKTAQPIPTLETTDPAPTLTDSLTE